MSLIHSAMAKHYTGTKPFPSPQVKVTVANNSTLDITVAVKGVVHVGGIDCTHTFLVSPESKWNIIIGCDFLRAHDCSISFNPGTLDRKDVTEETTLDMDDIGRSPPTTPSTIEDVLPNNITAEDRENLKQTLAPFHKVFTWADQPIGRTRVQRHHMETGTAPSQRQPAQRIPFHDREEPHAITEDILNQEIVRPSTSPYSAPVTLVKKKDGSLRLCIDYRD